MLKISEDARRFTKHEFLPALATLAAAFVLQVIPKPKSTRPVVNFYLKWTSLDTVRSVDAGFTLSS